MAQPDPSVPTTPARANLLCGIRGCRVPAWKNGGRCCRAEHFNRCYDCVALTRDGSNYCIRCLERRKKRRAERRACKKCHDCGADVATSDRVRCLRCLEKKRHSDRNRRRKGDSVCPFRRVALSYRRTLVNLRNAEQDLELVSDTLDQIRVTETPRTREEFIKAHPGFPLRPPGVEHPVLDYLVAEAVSTKVHAYQEKHFVPLTQKVKLLRHEWPKEVADLDFTVAAATEFAKDEPDLFIFAAAAALRNVLGGTSPAPFGLELEEAGKVRLCFPGGVVQVTPDELPGDAYDMAVARAKNGETGS